MAPQEFAPADTFYEPVQDTLVLGVPPLLLVLGLILLLAAGLLGWWLGREQVGADGGSDADKAPAEIHKAILAASSGAMAASSNDLKGKAQALHDTVERLIGPVLTVAKGVAPSMKGLAEALKGEKKVEVKPTTPAHTESARTGDGAHDTHDAGGAATGPVTVNQVYIGGVAVAQPASGHHHGSDHAHGHGHGHAPPAPAKAETQAMTGPEQIEALSRAVRQFHDHWLDGPARIRELKEARNALSRRPPASALKSDGRVWDRH